MGIAFWHKFHQKFFNGPMSNDSYPFHLSVPQHLSYPAPLDILTIIRRVFNHDIDFINFARNFLNGHHPFRERETSVSILRENTNLEKDYQKRADVLNLSGIK
jgi:hypothetical protein